MDDTLIVSKEYFEKLIEKTGRQMMGEVMSQFETGNPSIPSIKQAVKDTIWENYRDFTAQMKAFSKGVKFITPRTDKRV